jgi:hypothetical protein
VKFPAVRQDDVAKLEAGADGSAGKVLAVFFGG